MFVVDMWKSRAEARTSGRVQIVHGPKLGHVGRRKEEGREVRGEPGPAAKRPEVQKKWSIKMVGLYREEHPSSLGWRSIG